MLKNEKARKNFWVYFKYISIWAWVIKVLPIPISIIQASLLATTVDFAINGETGDLVRTAIILLLIVSSFSILSSFIKTAFEKSKTKALHKCKMLTYNKFTDKNYYELTNTVHGEAIENLNDDFGIVSSVHTDIYPDLLIGLFSSCIYFVFLSRQSLSIAFILLLMSCIQSIQPLIIKRLKKINYEETRDIEAEITNFIISAYKGFDTIKTYYLRDWLINRLKRIHSDYARVGIKAEIIGTSEEAVYNLVSYILKYGTYGIVGLFILFEKAEINAGIETIALSAPFFSAVMSVFSGIPKLAVLSAAEKRLDRWFYISEIKKDSSLGDQQEDMVMMNNVTLLFDDVKVFENFSVNINIKGIIFIRGSNGSGKTSIIKLILGFLKPNNGSVLVGRYSTEQLEEKQINEMFFYLQQQDPVFDMTPRELFSILCPNGIDECLKYAQQFGLSISLINDLNLSELSGGELKKTYLSIAFTVKRRVLLLDEPTNSLDAYGQDVLFSLMKESNKNIIVVSHDKRFEEIADSMVDLEDDLSAKVKIKGENFS